MPEEYIKSVDLSDQRYRNEKGELHQEDRSVVIDSFGNQECFQNGLLHREDGPSVILANGDQIWCQNDKLHRVDGPAIIHDNGFQSWWKNGERHREDGPAIIYSNGYKKYYFKDRKVTEEWIDKYQKIIKNHILLGVPVRDKWRVREIILSWYDNPKFRCVKNRLEKEYSNLFIEE